MPRFPLMALWLLAAGCAAAPAFQPAPFGAPAEPDTRQAGLSDSEAASPAPAVPARWHEAQVPGKAVASSGFAQQAVDADPASEWNPRAAIAPGRPQWLALPLRAPAKGRLAIVWQGHGLHFLYGEYGRPRSYEVQASSDSTDGKNGQWRTVESVHDNMVRSRVGTVDAPGTTWVRLNFTTSWDSHYYLEPFLREVAVYEAEAPGGADVWLIMGDSVTSVAFDPARPQAFSEAVARRQDGRRPIILSGGTGGDESANIAERLKVALPTLPANSVVGLCYGSNDAARGVPITAYKARLQGAIDMIRANGHQPVLAVVPWSLNGAIGDYADACRELSRTNRLPAGPDFYAYFKQHPDELRTDKVHPAEKGIAAMQRLWAEASEFRYQP